MTKMIVRQVTRNINVHVSGRRGQTGPQGPPGTPGTGGGAVASVNGRDGAVVITSSDIGLSNVNNTSDLNKPVSTATVTYINNSIGTSKAYAIAMSVALG